MNYIDEIFQRADIQQIREFLVYGVEGNTDLRPYRERIESAHKALFALLRRDYPDQKDFEEITGPIYGYVNAVEAVYMEIGLQVGAVLAAQTAHNFKSIWKKAGSSGDM